MEFTISCNNRLQDIYRILKLEGFSASHIRGALAAQAVIDGVCSNRAEAQQYVRTFF